VSREGSGGKGMGMGMGKRAVSFVAEEDDDRGEIRRVRSIGRLFSVRGPSNESAGRRARVEEGEDEGEVRVVTSLGRLFGSRGNSNVSGKSEEEEAIVGADGLVVEKYARDESVGAKSDGGEDEVYGYMEEMSDEVVDQRHALMMKLLTKGEEEEEEEGSDADGFDAEGDGNESGLQNGDHPDEQWYERVETVNDGNDPNNSSDSSDDDSDYPSDIEPYDPVLHGLPRGPPPKQIGKYMQLEENLPSALTEFVWVEGAEASAYVCGSWDNWRPHKLYHEGAGLWSSILRVPVGTREFRFIIDGEWMVSSRHPALGDQCKGEQMNNVRVIVGTQEETDENESSYCVVS